ncbi:MAG: hypothetical protein ABL964_06420 [Steroidobacteraceae bacterium]
MAPSPFAAELNESSTALQRVLRAVLDVERRTQGMLSPLELVKAITTGEEWAWIRPLYGLIADIDHALAGDEPLPATEIAAIGAHARAMLSGSGAPIEQAFLDRYRALLQVHTEIAMAHGGAMQALKKLPPEPDTESERLRAHHQWNERRLHQRQHR